MIRRHLIALFAAFTLFAAPTLVLAAALSITASNVKLISGDKTDGAVAGEAITAGMGVYQKAADARWYKAQCDGTAEEAGSLVGVGIALGTADAAGAVISVARHGAVVQIGAGTAGTVYYVGATAGGINPVADLATTNYSTPIAIGVGSSPARVQIIGKYAPGAVLP
jgi:hypothetical protein